MSTGWWGKLSCYEYSVFSPPSLLSLSLYVDRLPLTGGGGRGLPGGLSLPSPTSWAAVFPPKDLKLDSQRIQLKSRRKFKKYVVGDKTK